MNLSVGAPVGVRVRMLLIDGNSHEVYELDDACVHNHANQCTSISFSEFETLAHSPKHAGLFANMLLDRRGIIPIKLKPSGSVAWGARLAVHHNGELPVDARVLGAGFLFVWPQSTAIHAFFELQEAARRRGESNLMIGTSMRPSYCFKTHEQTFGHKDVETTRRVATRELTVAQRLFLACLTRRATVFPLCGPNDRWKERIDEADMRAEERFVAQQRARMGLLPPPPPPPPSLPSKEEAERVIVVRRGTARFELPDEIVGLIVAARLTNQTVETAESVYATLSVLVRVSRQFRVATNNVVNAMRARVQQGCLSLLSDTPQDHTRVVRALEITRLTVRKALELEPGWHAYVRARREVERMHATVHAVPTPARPVG